MKKFIAAALAATLIATPTFAAPAQYGQRAPAVEAPRASATHYARGQLRTPVAAQQSRGNVQHAAPQQVNRNQQANRGQQRWRTGQRFDQRQATNYRQINNPRAYRLNAAPRGSRWVQSGSDAVLIGITSGIISAIVSGALR